ncbi:ABC transporter substrate-binding protein [Microvirga antarctica]|uniref:ABC transporter substrate-binding protein n=1 Tax=Microvirga antarctica TaxID=2819233 RepID=UPI001FEA4F45|nr:ABC transporter substrate-binding protein [Microvirga antarctica]
MRRREVLALVGYALAAPQASLAQTRARPVIGYLGPESPLPFASRLKAFREGLAESGYVEGRNVEIAYRWAEGRYNRLPTLAAELASQNVDVIAAPGGAPVALAAKSATVTIPIVFEMGGDPVALGVVDSLSHSRSNLTGISSLSVEVSGKRLEFVHELLPNAAAFAVIVNPTSPTVSSQLRDLSTAANALGVRLHVLNASTEADFDTAFAALPHLEAGGIVFTSDPYFANRSQQLAALTERHSVPAITQSRDFPMAGGLMSYGGDFTQSHRRAGLYVGRILNGEKASDLPVQLVTKVELFINLKTAGSLGVTVPPALMSSADMVIE